MATLAAALVMAIPVVAVVAIPVVAVVAIPGAVDPVQAALVEMGPARAGVRVGPAPEAVGRPDRVLEAIPAARARQARPPA